VNLARPGLLKSVSVYGASTGLMRGAPLLYLPLLTATLPLADFGLYSLAQAVALLLVPVLSLNGAAAVEREGSEDAHAGDILAGAFLMIVCGLTLVSAAAVFLADDSRGDWLVFATLLGGLEAVHLLFLTLLRLRNHEALYAGFALVRVLGMVALLSAGLLAGWDLRAVLLAQTLWYATLVVGIIVWLRPRASRAMISATHAVLPYTLPLVPHSAAQWAMSSADRVFVKMMIGEEALGIYAIGYTIASVLMLLNSGIALALPPIMFRNYAVWIARSQRQKFLYAYSAATVCIGLGMVALLELDRRFMHLIGTYDAVIPALVGCVTAGLYVLGVYLLFTNVLAFRRKTARLAIVTAVAALLNAVLTVVLLATVGVIGAAISTLLTYAAYLLLVMRAAHNVEPDLDRFNARAAVVMAASASVLVAAGVFQASSWR
jgi:O-antigen/teichoic acid export membrane protein